MPDLEMALSQAEMALSQASLTSHTTTFSFLQATVARAKEEIEKRDATIKLLETSAGILTKYVPPSLDDKRVYLGKNSPSSVFKTKHHRLHYLNILPQHLRSKVEEDEIDELMFFFNEQKEAGNVEGEPCGLTKMWIRSSGCLLLEYLSYYRFQINCTFLHFYQNRNFFTRPM